MEPLEHLDVVDRLLTTTRTVRFRLDLERPVDPAVVTECLDLALQAPTGGDAQGWRWIVVTDPDMRGRVAAVFSDAMAWATRAAGGDPADPGRSTGNPMVDGARHLAAHLHEVPVLVVACVKGRLEEPVSAYQAAALYGSIFPAVWGFQLALRSRGLASAFTTVHAEREAQMAEVLGIPDGVTQAALVPVAHLKEGELHRAGRRPVTEVAYANRWGVPLP